MNPNENFITSHFFPYMQMAKNPHLNNDSSPETHPFINQNPQSLVPLNLINPNFGRLKSLI